MKKLLLIILMTFILGGIAYSATNTAINLSATNNADGFDISGGTTSRKITVTGANITLSGSGTNTYTFPASTDTLVGRDSTDTLTNKTLTSPTLTTPALGTPSSGTLTNATGLPISTGVSGLGTGVATFLATPSSANLASALTNETGSGAAVFGTSPNLFSPTLGTAGSTSGTIVFNNATSGTITVSPALGALGTKGLVLPAENGQFCTTGSVCSGYAPATSGSSILYGNGSGGFSNVSIGSGLTFSTGTLSASGSGSGTVSTGNAYYLAYYPASGTTVASAPSVTVDSSGNVSANSFITAATNVPQTDLYPQYASDTHWIIGVNGDGGNDNDDNLVISEGTTLGSSNRITVAPGGLVTIPSATITTFTGHTTIEGVTSTGATGTGSFVFGTSPTIATPTITTSLTTSSANIVTDTSTGTQIATSSSQKLGFWGSTPTVRPSGNICTAMSSIGLISSCTESASGGGGGSGTVNTGTAGYVTYYPSTGTTVDDSSLYTDGTNFLLGTTSSGMTSTNFGAVNNSTTGTMGFYASSTTGAPLLYLSGNTGSKTPGISLNDNNGTGSDTGIASLNIQRNSSPGITGGTRNDLALYTASGAGTKLLLGTEAAIRMTIDSTGKVGVGTNSPNALFNVGSSSDFQVDSSGRINWGSSSSTRDIYMYRSGTSTVTVDYNGTGGVNASGVSVFVNGALTANEIYTPTYLNGNTGASYTVNWKKGKSQNIVLNNSTTLVWANNSVPGKILILYVVQDGTGSRTITWPASVKWPSGTAPTLTTTANKTDVFTFISDGTYEYGQTYGQNY